MNFKKDYINYVLYNVLFHGIPANSVHGSVTDYPPLANNLKLKKILEKIINNNEIVKMTFLIGKTAGLEFLFKYLLYISDKIDKSQITIFNLKENFEYDVINLKKICEKIEGLHTEPQAKPADVPAEDKKEEAEIKQSKPVSTIKIDIKDEKELIETKKEETEETEDEEKTDEQEGLTLIENAESASMENEVFELANIEDFEESETATEEVSDFEEETEEGTDEGNETAKLMNQLKKNPD